MLELALKFLGPVFMVALFFSLLSISQRKKEKTISGDLVLDYGWIFKGIAWLGFCVTIGAPVAMYFQEISGVQEYNIVGYVLAIILPLTLSLYMFQETRHARFIVKGSSLHCESPWQKNRIIEISDIVQVTFSQIFKYYKLKTKDEDVVKIYMFMNGVPQFLDLLEKQLNIRIERYY